MITPISPSNSSADKAAAVNSAPKQPAPPEPSQAKAKAPDVVELSQPAQARLLRQQGVSIPEIALQLKLDVKTVKGYFA